METKYYTVEQISELLKIHPKTVQRYIREGKLRANKIGKSWRVTGHDLSVFAENTKRREPDPNACPEEKVKASSVIDIDVDDRDDGIRIANALTAALNTKPPEYGRSSMHVQFLEAEFRVRVTLWGGIRFMEAVFGFVAALTDNAGKE